MLGTSSPISRGEFSLSSVTTLYLYQMIVDVWVGKDFQGADMYMPVPLDLYFSQETGGRNATYRWSEWETLKKELRVRGYDYAGKLYSRTTRDGQDLEKRCQEYVDFVADAIRSYDPENPQKVQIQYVPRPYVPFWIFLSLVLAIMVMGLVMLQTINH